MHHPWLLALPLPPLEGSPAVNLDRAISLLSRLPIKNRDTGEIQKFIPNPNQVTFYGHLKEQFARIGMVRAIVLKARRVGISSASDGLLVPHCLSRPQAHAKIVAHRNDTAEGLFRVPRDLAHALPFPVGEIMTRKIIFDHPHGHSILDIATAGAVSGGRGLTLSALHLSEAAQFTGEDSFLSAPGSSKGRRQHGVHREHGVRPGGPRQGLLRVLDFCYQGKERLHPHLPQLAR